MTTALIDDAIALWRKRAPDLRASWHDSTKPFPYIVVEDALPLDFATRLRDEYPPPEAEVWDKTTFTHQRAKLQLRKGFTGTVARFFELSAHPDYIDVISEITAIPKLLADPELVGGGLHQSLDGGFLDVHIDFNLHPTTKQHRRLNLLWYANPDWKASYEGFLELWDMDRKLRVENVAPAFNRAVLFETGERSYHGHPKPLKLPRGITRKSMAVYYYTATRPVAEVAPEHNTMYRQTTGVAGYVKTLVSSAHATRERFRAGGLKQLRDKALAKLGEVILGTPPKNG